MASGGWFKPQYPQVVGHEIVGKAVRVGKDVKHVKGEFHHLANPAKLFIRGFIDVARMADTLTLVFLRLYLLFIVISWRYRWCWCAERFLW